MTFSRYESLLVAMLTIVQFTVVLDFAVMAPLGAELIDSLDISTKQFGILVSAYALSAGASGFLLAGFIDRFDRKNILLIMYVGFIIGTVCCAIAPSYYFLLVSRIVAGVFGGVMSGITFATVTDFFRYEIRGRVMGFIQMAFSASQILGIPLGLYLAHIWSWHVPFYFIVGIGLINIAMLVKFMKPILSKTIPGEKSSYFQVIKRVFTNKKYLIAFSTTFFLATGGFILQPYVTPHLVFDLNYAEDQLPYVFFSAGIATLIGSPIFGKLSDSWGKYKLFVTGSLLAGICIIWFVNVPAGNLFMVAVAFSCMMLFVSSRIISATAMITAIPDASERGAFMNINSAIQQSSGGIASILGGIVLIEKEGNQGFENFQLLGLITFVSILICILLMYRVNKIVEGKYLK
ncbi:MFS transporter [Sphingobacterium mizutaii]|uniref:MFS transporter n=1 Tax=Sphingobacterium mizutaii TaxID=1010 RepID=UPI001628202C|nr:MFS transporter [Sphingobacterium mizutaii]